MYVINYDSNNTTIYLFIYKNIECYLLITNKKI